MCVSELSHIVALFLAFAEDQNITPIFANWHPTILNPNLVFLNGQP